MERTLALRSLAGAAVLAIVLLFTAGAAVAEDYDVQPSSSVQGATTTPDYVSQPPAAVEATSDTPLAVTGSDLAGLVILGGGLIVVGGIVVAARRRSAA